MHGQLLFRSPTHDPHDERRASVAHGQTWPRIGRMAVAGLGAILEADWLETQAEIGPGINDYYYSSCLIQGCKNHENRRCIAFPLPLPGHWRTGRGKRRGVLSKS